MSGPTGDQWRAAAQVLREHAAEFDALARKAGPPMCGVVLPNAGPNGEPVACAFTHNHTFAHSWAFLPTIVNIP